MKQPDAPSGAGNGLKTVVDTLVAPKEAFARLRAAPTWGWAFLLAFVLMTVGYFLQHPAVQHASLGTMQHAMATNAFYASMSDEQKQAALDRIAHPSTAITVFNVVNNAIVLLLFGVVNAAILLGASAIARGSTGFRNLFAGTINIAVPAMGVNWIVLGIICQVLGPDHFASLIDVFRVLPSLALVAPGATGTFGWFLTGIQIFTLWGLALNVLMLRETAGVKGALCWIAPVVVLVLGALLQAVVLGFLG